MSLTPYEVLSHLPYVKRVASHMRRQQVEVAGLIREMELLQRRFKAENYTPRYGYVLHELADLLRPMRVVGCKKTRVGAVDDGGYIVLDDFKGVTRAYSLGVGPEVSFDIALAERGIDIIQFDHTVEKSPSSHPRFTLHKKKIEYIQDFLSSPDEKQLLKIDIEGSEWELFGAAKPEEMSRFGQIVGEFHDFNRFYDETWHRPALRALKKINETHQLIHIHGNNCEPSFWYGEMQWPFALELTYVLRSAYEFKPTDELFPGELDGPNSFRRFDYILDGLFKK